MCGIFAAINQNGLFSIYEGLKRLEYRGYDSFGYAAWRLKSKLPRTGQTRIKKRVGELDKEVFNNDTFFDSVIGHVRWATNGEVSEKNAHPQCGEYFYVVHNGIIENAPPHMLDTAWLVNLLDLHSNAQYIYNKIEGDNSFVFMSRTSGEVWCVAKGSKRLYITDNGYVSSDLNALSGFSKEAHVLNNGFYRLGSLNLSNLAKYVTV